jgi:hypothetical protein
MGGKVRGWQNQVSARRRDLALNSRGGQLSAAKTEVREIAWPESADQNLLPEVGSLAEARMIIDHGLENYLMLLGARRYCQELMQLTAEDDLQRQIVVALSNNSLDPEQQYLAIDQLRANLPESYTDQQLSVALQRLIALGVISKPLDSDCGPFALDYPLRGELLPPWRLSQEDRRELIYQHGLAHAYFASGAAALIWRRARDLAESPAEEALIDRLFTDIVKADGATDGITVDELVFDQYLSNAERQELVDNLQRLVDRRAINKIQPSGQSEPHYSLPPLPVRSSPEVHREDLGGAAGVHEFFWTVSREGVEYCWRHQGRVEQARQFFGAQAENDIERKFIDCLSGLYRQELDFEPVFDLDHLLEDVAEQLNVSDRRVSEVLEAGSLLQRLPRDGRYIGLPKKESGAQAAPAIDRQLSAGHQACLLANHYGLSDYYRAQGQGAACWERLATSAERFVGQRDARWLADNLLPSILDPELRWFRASEMFAALNISGADRHRLLERFLDQGLLTQRIVESPEGHQPEFAVVGAPAAQVDGRQ